jgi:hypothetical protein
MQMLVDSLAKGLPPNVFRKYVANMSLMEHLWFYINKL